MKAVSSGVLFIVVAILYGRLCSEVRGETPIVPAPEAPEVKCSEVPKQLILKNGSLRCEFSTISGVISKIDYLPKQSSIVAGCEDVYIFKGAAVSENGDQVIGCRIEREQGNEIVLLCVNPELPNIEIIKKYRLEKDRLEKTAYFKAQNDQDDGKLFFLRTKLRTDSDFYKGGWFYTPMWDGGSGPGTGNIPFRNEGEVKGRTQITDLHGGETIFLQPRLGIGLAQYKFKINGHWERPSTGAVQQEIDDKAYLEPGGWELYITGEVIHGGTFLSCESQYMVFEGDAREFHRRYLKLPGYEELTKGQFPDWYRKVKYITNQGLSTYMLNPKGQTEVIDKYLSDMTPDEFLLVSLGEWTYTGDYHLDGKLENNVFSHFESTAKEMKKALDQYRDAAGGRMKVLFYTWQNSASDKSVTYMKDHPDWLIHTKDNELIASSSGEKSNYLINMTTREHEDFIVDQYRKLLEYFPADCTYVDGGFGEAITYFPNKMFIHNYNSSDLFHSIKTATEDAHKLMFTNGSTDPSINHGGIFELNTAHGYLDEKDWRISANFNYLTKYCSPAGGGTVVNWGCQGDSNRQMMYGLKPDVRPFKIGQNMVHIFTDANIAMEVCDARIVDGDIVRPNWWNLETDTLESALLREGDSYLLGLIHHGKQEQSQKVSVDLSKLDFRNDQTIYLWEQEVQTRYGLNLLAHMTDLVETMKWNFRVVSDAGEKLELETKLKPEYLKFITLTQVPAFVYSVDGRRNNLLLTSNRDVSISGSLSGGQGEFQVKCDATQAELLIYLPERYRSAQVSVDSKPVDSQMMSLGDNHFVRFAVPKGAFKITISEDDKSGGGMEALTPPHRSLYVDDVIGFYKKEGNPVIQAAYIDGKPCWKITGPGTLMAYGLKFKGTDGVAFDLKPGTAKEGDFSVMISPGDFTGWTPYVIQGPLKNGFSKKVPLIFSGWKSFQWESSQFDEKSTTDWEECEQFYFKIPEGTLYLSDFRFLPYTGPEKKLVRKEVIIPRTKTPPELDGKADDKCWNNAASIAFGVGDGGVEPTALKLMYDGQNIYIAGTCMEPILKLPPKTPRDGRIFVVPDFEVFLNPMGMKQVYQLITNPAADQWDGVYSNFEGHELDRSWDGAWRVAAGMDFQAAWHFEMAVPFSDFGMKTPSKGDIWLGGFFRQSPAGASGWIYNGGTFYNPKNMGDLIFGE